MIDTGYGIYFQDVVNMLQYYGLGDLSLLKRIYITHADADHCGAAGLFPAPSYLNHKTFLITRETSRAYGSSSQDCILEEVYTKIINLFSRFTPPENIVLFPEISSSTESIEKRGSFPVVARFRIGDLEFEALEGIGGHMHGEVFYLCPDEGLLFPEDALINFSLHERNEKLFFLLFPKLMKNLRKRQEMSYLLRTWLNIGNGRGKTC